MPVTLKDVAKQANVTVSTVSRILNTVGKNTEHVYSEQTRQRVLEAARNLNYRPNLLARAFRTKKSYTVGLLAPDLADPNISLEVQMLEELLDKRGYRVLAGFTASESKRQLYVRDFVSRGVDGLIGIYTRLGSKEKVPAGLPVVGIGPLAGTGVSYVDLDRAAGAYKLIKHMIEVHGRREIAVFGYPLPNPTMQQRLEGCRRACDECGVAFHEELVFYQEAGASPVLQFETARRQLDQCLDLLGRPPQVIFASNDLKAVALLRRLSQLGYSVPQDVAVVGFDGIAIGGELPVGLTTVRRPQKQMTEIAVGTLLEFVEEGIPNTPRQVVLDPQLVVRESCGCGGDSPMREHARQARPMQDYEGR